jgi:hypothetical protein
MGVLALQCGQEVSERVPTSGQTLIASHSAFKACVKLRQLGDVHRDAARLIARQKFSSRAPSRLILEIDVGERLSVVVAHHEARGLFFDRLRRLESVNA